MSLLAQAILDAQRIVEDVTRGFGTPIQVTSPSGATAALSGLASDVFEQISEEGFAIAGRQASVTLSFAALNAAGLGIPQGVFDQKSKPWVVVFADATGTSHQFKVSEAKPDRTLGLVSCLLEPYSTL